MSEAHGGGMRSCKHFKTSVKGPLAVHSFDGVCPGTQGIRINSI